MPATVPSLPEPVLAEIFGHVCKHSTASERVSLSLVSLAARDVVASSWKDHAESEWGPLDWETYFRVGHSLEMAELGSSHWGVLRAMLASELRPKMHRAVRKAVDFLREQHLLNGPCAEQEYPWLAHRLKASQLNDRRRITSYVCVAAEDQPYRVLDSLISLFELRPPTAASPVLDGEDGDWEPVFSIVSPIVSLRHILLQFPFLPIDAGGGADRVIGAIARCYAAAYPVCGEWVGLPATTSDTDVTEAVHLIVYAAIMLQSDLHNVAVQPKMTTQEFADSLHRAPVLANMPEERIFAIYEDIRSAPLEYEEAIETFIRSNKDGAGDDQIIPATYSKYSRHSTLGALARLRGCCKCESVRRRAGQLTTARGRKDLRFLAKRLHGQRYYEIRLLAFLLVLLSVFWSSGAEAQAESVWPHWDVNLWARTAVLAAVCHYTTRA